MAEPATLNTTVAEASLSSSTKVADAPTVTYAPFQSEAQMDRIVALIGADLSEPYSLYTYRYFIHNWPKQCIVAEVDGSVVGVVVCKLAVHKRGPLRGYIGMLAVDPLYRRQNIGSNLVQHCIRAMIEADADEVVLETEITNKSAISLYSKMGFVKDKYLSRYYLNGVDALRLKLWLR